MQMPVFLTTADVNAVADWGSAIDALRRAYACQLDAQMVPPRSMARGSGIWLRSLTAISPLDGTMGCKLIAAAPRARCASYLISLFDPDTTELRALLDAEMITGIRTAATAVVAVDALAPARPLRVAVLGSGFEADAQLAALATARSIESATVFSPTAANRERFAERFARSLAVDVRATPTAQAAVRGSDVVICAARARNEVPVLQGEWLEPGMTVVSIGSTLQEQREVDVEVIRRSSLIVGDMPDEIARETGDMIAATAAGIAFASRLVSLSDLIGHRISGRASPQDIVLYKSVGSALQDIVIAELALERAIGRGLGTTLPVTVTPRNFGEKR
jgi:alanine dehydrogenase